MPDDPRAGAPFPLLGRLIAPHRPVLALAILACLLYLPSVWNRDLWSPDEPRYAEVAREMISRGDYILPSLNGEVYGEKPPLFFWLGILAARLPGLPLESGLRLVSVLAAFGTLMLTFLTARRLAGAEIGWLAALVLSTSGMFVVHASSGVIDGLLTFLVTAATACGMTARETRSPVAWAGFYALAGLALITKGPVGLIIPAAILILVALQEEGTAGARASHALWGLPLSAGVAALWLAPAIARGGADYARTILIEQNIGRAYDSWHHEAPLQYFLVVFPVSFMPWIPLLPGAIQGALTRLRGGSPKGARLALTWFLFTFVFFSLVSGKKTRYLLPLFPAASLLVAMELGRFLRGGAGGRSGARGMRALVPIVLCLGMAVASGLLLLALPGLSPDRWLPGLSTDQKEALALLFDYPGSLRLILPGLGLTGLGAAGLLRLPAGRRTALACLAAACVGAAGWAQWIGVPAANNLKSARPVAAAAEAALRQAGRVGPEPPVVTYRESHAGVFNFYLGRDRIPELSHAGRTASFLRGHPGAVVICTASDLDRLRARLEGLVTLECRRMGEEIVCAARAGAF